MTSATLLRFAFTSLRRNTGRSLLTALGVVIGVASVVVMVAIGEGAKAEIAGKIAGLGTNLVVVTPGSSQRTGVSGGAGSQDSLTMDDVEAIDREAQHVGMLSPVVMSMTMAIAGNANWRVPLHGVDTDYFDIRAWKVADGRPFEEQDIRAMRKICLLGQTVATALFGEGEVVGKTVRLRGIPVEIVGVLAKKGQTPDGTDQDDVVLLPYTTLRQRMAGRQFLGQILVSAKGPDEVAPAMEELRAILRETHRLGRSGEDDFTLRDQAAIAEAAQGTTQVMTTLLLVVASVALVVGGIGIMNIMLVSVTERTREIGIRRAVGARRRDVLAQFLVEAVALSTAGGALGVALGVGVTALVASVTGWKTDVTLGSVLLSLGFASAVGIFFGWWPARRAAALDPIQALRFT